MDVQRLEQMISLTRIKRKIKVFFGNKRYYGTRDSSRRVRQAWIGWHLALDNFTRTLDKFANN